MNEEIKEIVSLSADEDIETKYINEKGGYVYKNIDIYELLDYITNLQEENQKLVKVIEEAIKYNKELCELYDCGMELSNAQTNLVILGDEDYKLTELKGGNND